MLDTVEAIDNIEYDVEDSVGDEEDSPLVCPHPLLTPLRDLSGPYALPQHRGVEGGTHPALLCQARVMDTAVKIYCVHTEPNFSLPWQVSPSPASAIHCPVHSISLQLLISGYLHCLQG